MIVAYQSTTVKDNLLELREHFQRQQKINSENFDQTMNPAYLHISLAYSHASLMVSETLLNIASTPGDIIAKDDEGNQFFIIK